MEAVLTAGTETPRRRAQRLAERLSMLTRSRWAYIQGRWWADGHAVILLALAEEHVPEFGQCPEGRQGPWTWQEWQRRDPRDLHTVTARFRQQHHRTARPLPEGTRGASPGYRIFQDADGVRVAVSVGYQLLAVRQVTPDRWTLTEAFANPEEAKAASASVDQPAVCGWRKGELVAVLMPIRGMERVPTAPPAARVGR